MNFPYAVEVTEENKIPMINKEKIKEFKEILENYNKEKD
jgi:hypothetical protein